MIRFPFHRWAVLALGLMIFGGDALEAWAQAQGNRRTGAATGAAQRRTGTGTGSVRDYGNSTLLGEANVTSDPETRRLIVITDDETAEAVREVIQNLDRPKPQVLIKVVFLELTYRNASDIGIEGFYRGVWDNSTTGIVNQAFGLASDGIQPMPPGAGIYQILSKDWGVTLRAIAQAGDAQLLSRPSIMARNNQQAVITVGQQVPLITNVRYDNFGNQINSVTYTDVGILLRVTPFIGADGMVEMIVAPETSELAERSQWVPIAVGASAPTINTRSANTVVVTPDGQTVVIGGLMQKAKAESVSKIPLLSDIPLIGGLFKRTIKDGRRTELLIFLTPYVVRSVEELAALTIREKNTNVVIPRTSETEAELNRFLDQLPEGPEPLPMPVQPEKKKK
jgi:general secretion pathway protein D